jgi:hypothetical protein
LRHFVPLPDATGRRTLRWAQMQHRANRYEPEYWRDRGVKAQALLQELHDLHARRLMLQIAMMYSAMALRAEIRAADNPATQ